MAPPANALEVAVHLGRLSRQLDDLGNALEAAELDAARKRLAFDVAFSEAFVKHAGSVDLRKHRAVLDTQHERAAADVADVVVRHLRRRIKALETRIEVGRSYGTTVRAELATLGHTGGLEP
jgi:hypothetical protein